MDKRFAYACSLIICLWIAARFVGLEDSPPGFYVDEAGATVNAICLKQTGADFSGSRFPLFSDGPSYGIHNPTFTYPAALWSMLFGDSIESFRAFVAFFVVLTIVGLYFFARLFLGEIFGILVALVAASSPWSFHFSRIAWDPPLATAGLIWGYYFLYRSERKRDALLAALFLSFGVYSYAAARVQVVLMMALISLIPISRPPRWLTRTALVGAIGTVLCTPLILFSFTERGFMRADRVSIFSQHFFEHEANGSIFSLIEIFLIHLSHYFDPVFLFFQGDRNLRHSPNGIGQLGFLEVLALGFVFWSALRWLLRDPGEASPPDAITEVYSSRGVLQVLVLACVGIFTSLAPAALTWESIPHALRAINAWPFVALLTGLVLWKAVLSFQHAPALILGVSIVYGAYFGLLYFDDYPKKAGHKFDTALNNRALAAKQTGDWGSFVRDTRSRDPYAVAYYLLRFGNYACDSPELSELRTRASTHVP